MSALLEHPLLRGVMLFVAITLVLLLSATLLRPVLLPLLCSFVLYALLEPMVSALVRSGYKNSAATSLILLILLFLMVISLIVFLPRVMSQVSDFQHQLPQVWVNIESLFISIEDTIKTIFHINVDAFSIAEPIVNTIEGSATDLLLAVGGGLVSVAWALLLIPLFSFFLLRDFKRFRNAVMDWLPNQSFELGWLIYGRVAKQLQSYVRGVMVQTSVMAIITGIGFSLLGIEMAAILGVVAGLLNLIPYIGPLMAMVPPVLLTFGAVGFEPWMPLAVIGVVLFAQVVDNIIVIPSVIANAVNLHPLSVLLGVIIFGYLFGFIGMLIAIPVLSSAKIVFLGLVNGLSGRIDNRKRSI